MSSIDTIMSIARWAIQSQQLGITVTSHNVANVNTPGYSRQRLLLATAKPWSDWPPNYQKPGQVGSGVQAVAIERVYDQFLGVQIRGELSERGSLEAQQKTFERMEAIFTSISDSDLESDFNAFFSAWENLSTHPEGMADRIAVREAGVALAQRFRGQMEALVDLQDYTDQSVQITVGKVNELAAQIADLNVEIGRVVYRGENPNDLLDARDLRLDELAELLPVQTWENEHGLVSVMGPGGRPLVIDDQYWELTTQETNPRQSDVMWLDGKGGMTPITGFIRSGSIGGLQIMRDQQIPQMMTRLDEMAKELIWATNVEHAASVGLSPQSTMTSQLSVPAGVSLNDAVNGPPFGARVQAGELHIWVYDNSDPPVPQNQVVVNVNPAWTLDDLANDIQAQSGGTLQATVNADRTMTIQGVGIRRFAIAQDDSYSLSAIGLNTFFVGSEALFIDMAPGILQDAELVGASRVDDDGSLTGIAGRLSPGDNRGALAVAALRDTPLVGSSTLEGAFGELISELGFEASLAYSHLEAQETVVHQLEDHRSSISGVNLDEEMINLTKYQMAYEAAAKLIQTADEMVQTILELK